MGLMMPSFIQQQWGLFGPKSAKYDIFVKQESWNPIPKVGNHSFTTLEQYPNS
jgi:hypothetical protein